MPNEKVYRYSTSKIVLMVAALSVILFLALFDAVNSVLLFGLVAIGLISTASYWLIRIQVSEDEISTRTWLGTKSLRWNEIERVSMRGQNVRLHSYDGNVTLSVSSQVEGYAEILDVLLRKRPNLFEPVDNDIMSRGIAGSVAVLLFGLLIIGFAVPIILYQREIWFFGLLFIGMGGYVMASFFLSPQSIAIQGKSLLVKYLFREVSYPAEEIISISLEQRRTKNGIIYYVLLKLNDGRGIRLPAFHQGSSITYQILKRWHEKATRAF